MSGTATSAVHPPGVTPKTPSSTVAVSDSTVANTKKKNFTSVIFNFVFFLFIVYLLYMIFKILYRSWNAASSAERIADSGSAHSGICSSSRSETKRAPREAHMPEGAGNSVVYGLRAVESLQGISQQLNEQQRLLTAISENLNNNNQKNEDIAAEDNTSPPKPSPE
jgi:hypothetical protein